MLTEKAARRVSLKTAPPERAYWRSRSPAERVAAAEALRAPVLAAPPMLNADFKEFVALLNSSRVEYLVVGGYALAGHGHPRYTGDLDSWVKPTPDNVPLLLALPERFGFGSLGLAADDFAEPGAMMRLGYAGAHRSADGG